MDIVDEELTMYAIVRADLNMPLGKTAAQTGHAFLLSFEQARNLAPDIAHKYLADPLHRKVILQVKNLEQLMRAWIECGQAGLPRSLVEDAGLTVFTKPTITVMGLGPIQRISAPKYIKRLRLL